MNHILPSGIVTLSYSQRQRLFHFEIEFETEKKGWVSLKSMTTQDATDFCQSMDKKYVDGRLKGILPELSVIKLELDLFFELKAYRRKLAGR